MFKAQGEKCISTSPFIKTQWPATVYVWNQILYIYLCFQHGNPIPKRKVIIIIKFYKKVSTYPYLFSNGDIMNVKLTLCRVLITPKVYLCPKLKSVLEIPYYLLCLKALKSISVIARLKKNSDFLQLCLIFGSISKLIIVVLRYWHWYECIKGIILTTFFCCLQDVIKHSCAFLFASL